MTANRSDQRRQWCANQSCQDFLLLVMSTVERSFKEPPALTVMKCKRWTRQRSVRYVSASQCVSVASSDTIGTMSTAIEPPRKTLYMLTFLLPVKLAAPKYYFNYYLSISKLTSTGSAEKLSASSAPSHSSSVFAKCSTLLKSDFPTSSGNV